MKLGNYCQVGLRSRPLASLGHLTQAAMPHRQNRLAWGSRSHFGPRPRTTQASGGLTALGALEPPPGWGDETAWSPRAEPLQERVTRPEPTATTLAGEMGRGRHPVGVESDAARLARLEKGAQAVGAVPPEGGPSPRKPKKVTDPIRLLWGCPCCFGEKANDRDVCWKREVARPRGPPTPRLRPARPSSPRQPRERPPGPATRGKRWGAGCVGADAGAEIADTWAELAAAQKWPGRGRDGLVAELEAARAQAQASRPVGAWLTSAQDRLDALPARAGRSRVQIERPGLECATQGPRGRAA